VRLLVNIFWTTCVGYILDDINQHVSAVGFLIGSVQVSGFKTFLLKQPMPSGYGSATVIV
jgi:hypothetical protein